MSLEWLFIVNIFHRKNFQDSSRDNMKRYHAFFSKGNWGKVEVMKRKNHAAFNCTECPKLAEYSLKKSNIPYIKRIEDQKKQQENQIPQHENRLQELEQLVQQKNKVRRHQHETKKLSAPIIDNWIFKNFVVTLQLNGQDKSLQIAIFLVVLVLKTSITYTL